MPIRQLNNLKILVVDDQGSVRLVIARLLERIGTSRVELAADGAEALRMIEGAEGPFDVVICDLNMPTEDGLVLLRRISELRTKPAVILMSGNDAVVLRAAQRLGKSLNVTILGAISKPLTGSALHSLLDVLNRPEAKALAIDNNLELTAKEIEAALEAGKFELWFQPQYDIPSRSVVGAEALLRLVDDERGIIGPASFIKAAESGGLITRLTEVVLEQATTWCATWQAARSPLSVSVNLSKAGLNDLKLPDRAEVLCQSRGLDPGRLVFELTESSIATDPIALLDIMTRLRLKGFRLSLDDFGTGFASLEELRSLPFHELKLDKQFVQSAGHDPRSRAILETAIGLASELQMSTVAEGVETEAMLRLVAALGCHTAQGYLIGRPMPAADMLGWLRERPSRSETASIETASVPTRVGKGRRDAEPSAPAPAALEDAVVRFAHDVASPLMVVLVLSETLLADAKLSDGHQHDLRQIHAAAEDVSSLIKALRKLAIQALGRPDDVAPTVPDGRGQDRPGPGA